MPDDYDWVFEIMLFPQGINCSRLAEILSASGCRSAVVQVHGRPGVLWTRGDDPADHVLAAAVAEASL